MRQDQYEKLQQLEERLTDVFIFEAEPTTWPGNGIAPNALDQQARGDRYWCKKNAVATLALVQRVAGLVHTIQLNAGTPPPTTPDGAPPDEEAHLDKEIASAEKEAAQLMDDLTKGKRKAAFDARTHGKG